MQNRRQRSETDPVAHEETESMDLQLLHNGAERLRVAAVHCVDESFQQIRVVSQRLQQSSELDQLTWRGRLGRQLHAYEATDAHASPDAEPETDAKAVRQETTVIERLPEGLSIVSFEGFDGLSKAALVFGERRNGSASLPELPGEISFFMLASFR